MKIDHLLCIETNLNVFQSGFVQTYMLPLALSSVVYSQKMKTWKKLIATHVHWRARMEGPIGIWHNLNSVFLL